MFRRVPVPRLRHDPRERVGERVVAGVRLPLEQLDVWRLETMVLHRLEHLPLVPRLVLVASLFPLLFSVVKRNVHARVFPRPVEQREYV